MLNGGQKERDTNLGHLLKTQTRQKRYLWRNIKEQNETLRNTHRGIERKKNETYIEIK
jgi:hypothetical protein